MPLASGYLSADRLALRNLRFPILAPEHLAVTRPDFVLILPWNIKDEIMAEMAHIRHWGGRFVVAIPQLTVSD